MMVHTYEFRGSKWLTFALMFGILALPACTRKEPRSEIVERAQQAGAGDLTSASAFSIEDWLRKHKDVAVQLNPMCAPVARGHRRTGATPPRGRSARLPETRHEHLQVPE